MSSSTPPSPPPSSSSPSPSPSSSPSSSSSPSPSSPPSSSSTSASSSLRNGAIAGLVESSLMHPFDTLKTRMQLSKTKASLLSTLSSIIRNEGLLSLYKGIIPMVAAITPKVAVRFTAFEFTSERYHRLLDSNELQEKGRKSNIVNFLSGFSAGCAEAVLVVTPSELIKIRLQEQTGKTSPASTTATGEGRIGIFKAISSIIREDGLIGMYRGMSGTIVRQAVGISASFTTFNMLKNAYQKGENTPIPLHINSFIGFCSGCATTTLATPADVIKTRMQSVAAEKGTNFFSLAKGIVVEAGVSGLFKGLLPRLLRIGPGQAIMFTVYEFLK